MMMQKINLIGTPCPLNYVKVKMALEKMESGEQLKVVLDQGEPFRNVKQSLEMDGHLIEGFSEEESFLQIKKK